MLYPHGLGGIFGPEWASGDLTEVHLRFIPLLREKGIDDATIQQIMVENPRRVLTVDPERYPGAVETLLAEVAVPRPWAELAPSDFFVTDTSLHRTPAD